MPENMAHFDQFESQKIDFLHVRHKFSTTKLDYPGKSRKTPSLAILMDFGFNLSRISLKGWRVDLLRKHQLAK